jgi:RNA polymerase sigma-70 factor (ECF subfamily)
MIDQKAPANEFTDFVHEHEPRLRHALIAACGGETGREAACEALAYGWEHWDRIKRMDNPGGYLYRVGLRRGRRLNSRQRPLYTAADAAHIPDVEPVLMKAVASLTARQRTTVVLVHCFEWSLSEVGETLGLSKTTVQNHLERGMTSLRRQIGESE